ncbi:MAG: ribosomal protein S18-alanine N-acetyltransferase [Clostridiales bacterium]|nr:ribosomal protein S18-alanine N-acetyltransferase [Clostridiales bacterium]
MIEIEIKDACAEDIDDILVVEELSFKIPWSRESFEEEIQVNELAIYLEAKAGARVIGYAGLWKVFDEGHITNIAVHPEFRKSGVGSALLEALIKRAAEAGIAAMTLEVRKSNIPARSLYAKYGFTEAGIRKGYYADNNEDAIIMWKRS